jgi:hypothetical protein
MSRRETGAGYRGPERRGLKADQTRLQREDGLIEIARNILERTAIEHLTLKPLPNKFLVPFSQKASLEESILTLSILTLHQPWFVKILSDITGSPTPLLRRSPLILGR